MYCVEYKFDGQRQIWINFISIHWLVVDKCIELGFRTTHNRYLSLHLLYLIHILVFC